MYTCNTHTHTGSLTRYSNGLVHCKYVKFSDITAGSLDAQILCDRSRWSLSQMSADLVCYSEPISRSNAYYCLCGEEYTSTYLKLMPTLCTTNKTWNASLSLCTCKSTSLFHSTVVTNVSPYM